MYRDYTIGVVIPAYNEEKLVGSVIRELPDFVDRVYVVDDCSTDDTWREVKLAARADAVERGLTAGIGDEAAVESGPESVSDGGEPLLENRADVGGVIGRVVPVRHSENRGAGGAIKTGYLVALDDKVDIVATIDGDGQMDVSLLSEFLDPIVEDEADYTKGNRLLNREYRREMPTFRLAGNALLTSLTKIASGYWKMMDPQNGYTAISYDALNNVAIENLYEYYGYCNDLLVKLNAKGMRIADIGTPAAYGDEESNIAYTAFIKNVSMMLLRNFLWRLKVRYFVLDFHPLGIFYVFGIITGLLGVIGGVWSVYAKLFLGESLFVRISISLIIFTMGSMFFMFAMLFDMQVNEDREVHL